MTDAPPDDLFLTLTPHKVIEAVEASGLLLSRVCYPLGSFENRVFEVECEDGARVIAKFYRPGRWTRTQILEEHRFLADLEEEEVPVCPTRPFPDGETLKQIDHIHYCLFERRGGRAPEEPSDDEIARLGRLVARVHNVGASRAAEARPRLSGDTLARAGLAWLERARVLPQGLERRYLEVARALADEADLRLEGRGVQRIHGDLHLGNLLSRDGVFHLLDFDDMMTGPPVQDVWLLVPGRDEASRRCREIFLEGYESFRAFDRRSLDLVEPLRALRMIHYAAWLARRWHDPIFPRTFVHFGTPAYWQEQTRDLEDLLALIRSDGVGGQGA